MARVLLYERVLDAVLICASSSHDTKIQNGVKIVKIKDEPIDTLTTDTTDTLVKNLPNVKNETIEKFEKKEKLRNITSDSGTKKTRTTRSSKNKNFNKCNICFRKFSSFRYCEVHKQCYIGNYQCKNCKMRYVTRKKLNLHTIICYNRKSNRQTSRVYCNFCNRPFKEKLLLQSHLFHLHSELIYSNNITKRKNLKSKNGNSFCKNGTLKTETHEESPSLSNLIKPKNRNITLINNNKSGSDDDATKTENLKTEESFSDGMSPTKKLRQPTLTEYLELCKRKRDINSSLNKFNIMKNSISSALVHDEKTAKNFKSKFSEMCNAQVDSSSANSSNLEQTVHSTLEEDRNHAQKPFVRLHADVEIMKSFLKNLPNDPFDTIIENKVKDQKNDIVSCYNEVPYSLRSLRSISSAETISNSRKRRNSKDISKKPQLNTEHSTGTEHNVTNIDRIDSNFWKTTMVHFKCKDCRIILTRCDEKLRNCHQIPAPKTTFKQNISLLPQCKSMLFQENVIQNKMVKLKKLEVSLKRLTTVPAVDITKVKTVSDIEKCNESSFLCKVCKKSFSSQLDKYMHIKSSHIVYMSSICDARYKRKHKLLQHYLSEHLSKQNQCCVCYALLSNSVELKRHLSLHCLKYVQKEKDRCSVDIEIKCSLIKNNYKCLYCGTAFLTRSNLMIHQSVCMQEEMTGKRKDSTKKINETLPKIILKVQCNKNVNGPMVIDDEKTHSNECSTKNSVETTNKHCISLINEEDPTVNEEVEKKLTINENKQKSSINNNLVTKEIGIINESSNSEKLLENVNFTISNQDVANVQSDAMKSKISIYPCDICGKQFHSDKNLQQHMRTFNYTTDTCPICGTGFSSKRLLQTHITAAHVPQISKNYNFHCVFCNQGFIKKYELRPHILHLHAQQILDTLTHDSRVSQTNSGIQTAMCNVCNLVFETQDRFMEHKMYYYKNHTFTCSLCAQNFQGMYMLNHHNKLTHYSENKRKSYNYICDICNEGFNHESHFHSHNMHVHMNEDILTETAKEFEERSQFNYASEIQEQVRNCSTNQYNEIEQSPNEYTCQICHLKCIDADDITKHTAFYSNDGKFSCDRCKRQFRTRDLFYQHRKLTHICRDIYNGYVCDICGEVLETAISLVCHKRHFHFKNIMSDNADDSKNSEQTLSSSTASEVMKHQFKSNEHNIEKSNKHNTVKDRYNCLFCDMKFVSINAIQTHIIKTHNDDLFAKRTASRPTLSTIQDDDIQKQSVQQLVETDQASTSAVTLISTLASASATKTSTSVAAANRTSTLAATTTTLTSVIALTTSTSAAGTTASTSAATTASTSAAATTASTSAAVTTASISEAGIPTSTSVTTVAATFETNSMQILHDKMSKNILDKNEVQDKTNALELSNQIKTILPQDNKIGRKTSEIPSLRKYRIDPKWNINIATLHTMAVAVNNKLNANSSKVKTSIPLSTELTNDLQNTSSLKSGLINEFKTNLISSNKSTNNLKVSMIQSAGPLQTVVVSQTWKNNEITNQKSEPMSSYNNCNSSYMCPLCPLEYPSLVFFHAHLRYAHAESVQNDMIPRKIDIQLNQSTQAITLIKCLLCPCVFTDENRYKSHLKISHTRYVHISNSKNIEKTDDKKKSTTPEIITVDDEDDNVKNSLDQHKTEDTVMLDHEKQNEKIGKLRVKSFAKIMENLSMECGLKDL
ncbi:uncharacterized protein [Anoplolepis gracilipes]|uniref:uncharacterized protein isoform X2 n=1 Tax=Anoplolepis gracilipes TaxID=354296 RepID=UPI003B9E8A12